jgi:vancomycin resistance protein YoaR
MAEHNETTLHADLKKMLDTVARTTGVRVTNARIEWDVTYVVGVEQPIARISGIQIVSESL